MANNYILALNAGSGSLKLGLFDWEVTQQLAEEEIDWTRQDHPDNVSNHEQALDYLLQKIQLDADQIKAIGHRVVHGGMEYQQPVKIDDKVKAVIKKYSEIDPLHNQAALQLIETCQKKFPNVPEVAAFDTSFHHTLPEFRYLYPVPYQWYEDYGIRRFGFHGLSFTYSTARAAELLQKPVEELHLLICHIGSGCSLASVIGGKSVATTMGFTPLDGLMMGSRSGAVDPGILLYLLAKKYQNVEELDQNLNHQAGMKGISGISSDLRDILPARAKGNERAAFAYEMFTDSIRQHIGAMLTTLGRLDALVFTDAVVENVPELRTDIIKPLNWLGLELDEEANQQNKLDTDIASAESKARILLIHVREELVLAQKTRQVLSEH